MQFEHKTWVAISLSRFGWERQTLGSMHTIVFFFKKKQTNWKQIQLQKEKYNHLERNNGTYCFEDANMILQMCKGFL